MIQLGKQEIMARSPWMTAGNPAEGERKPREHVCAWCKAHFVPASGAWAYRVGKLWFCRYQHLADWRKGFTDEPKPKPRKGPQPEKSCGEVSPDGWRTTESGCKARVKYCRDELKKRMQSYENAIVREDNQLRKQSIRAAWKWRQRLGEAEAALREFE